ncbi:armadillo-type protein [Mycena rosella]|uniref:Armadillo-type protein n=1 Tax=Mycena rosella TaxID=1033263 RepID=A0AAD7DQW2_MYCRO|nr:armadillo-type protein [Mycena rosella]
MSCQVWIVSRWWAQKVPLGCPYYRCPLLCPLCKVFILEIPELCRDENRWVPRTGVGTIGQLAKFASFHDSIKPFVPKIVELFKDDWWVVQEAAGTTAVRLLEYTTFHESIRPFVPQIMELLKDDDEYVRLAGATAIEKLVQHADVFLDSIQQLVPQIGNWLKEDSPNSRSAGATVMGKLVEKVTDLLKDSRAIVQDATSVAMGKFVEHGVFQGLPEYLRPKLGDWLTNTDAVVRSAGAAAIGTLSTHHHQKREEIVCPCKPL